MGGGLGSKSKQDPLRFHASQRIRIRKKIKLPESTKKISYKYEYNKVILTNKKSHTNVVNLWTDTVTDVYSSNLFWPSKRNTLSLLIGEGGISVLGLKTTNGVREFSVILRYLSAVGPLYLGMDFYDGFSAQHTRIVHCKDGMYGDSVLYMYIIYVYIVHDGHSTATGRRVPAW